jgi:hypothetical protein
VFIGVAGSKLALPDNKALGCKPGPTYPGTFNDRPTTDRISSGCAGADMVLFERVVDRGDGGSLLVQVITPDAARAAEIANSVKY